MICLSDFYETIADDPRIGPGHIVVYVALLHVWEVSGRIPEFEIATFEVMRYAKMRKRDTYLMRIRELASFGYIRYTPAENEYVKAVVSLKKL